MVDTILRDTNTSRTLDQFLAIVMAPSERRNLRVQNFKFSPNPREIARFLHIVDRLGPESPFSKKLPEYKTDIKSVLFFWENSYTEHQRVIFGLRDSKCKLSYQDIVQNKTSTDPLMSCALQEVARLFPLSFSGVAGAVRQNSTSITPAPNPTPALSSSATPILLGLDSTTPTPFSKTEIPRCNLGDRRLCQIKVNILKKKMIGASKIMHLEDGFFTRLYLWISALLKNIYDFLFN